MMQSVKTHALSEIRRLSAAGSCHLQTQVLHTLTAALTLFSATDSCVYLVLLSLSKGSTSAHLSTGIKTESCSAVGIKIDETYKSLMTKPIKTWFVSYQLLLP